MIVTVTVPLRAFRAIAPAMATNDVRYYLNGIYLETNRAETRLVATNGHRMHCVRINDDSALVDWPTSAIIPDTLVKAICKVKAPRYLADPTVRITLDEGKIGITLPDGTSISGTAIDGVYPDYRRVIPDKTATGEPAAYNVDYLADAIDGARAWTDNKKLDLFPKTNGDKSAIVSIDCYLAIVMPLRLDYLTDHAPAAWKDALEQPAMPQGVAA